MDVEPELDRLYQLPPGEFTAARDELAGRLRAEGERDGAEEVKKLRKPTAAVWLVNRLARERELDVQRLAKAGQALGAGRSADDFAAARDEEQRSLERLHEAARELAEREGIGTPSVERATQTLRAASLTDEGRTLLKRARLTEELQPPGFEALTGAPPQRAQRKPAKQAKPDARAERKAALAEAREASRRLKARELAAREGIGTPSIERATQTLRAASLTDEGRRLLKRARLTEELQPPGFEALTGLPSQPTTRKPAKKEKLDARAERKAALAEARETVRRLKAEERELRSAARAATRDAERAEAEAARLRDEADRAQATADETTAELARADAELEKLR